MLSYFADIQQTQGNIDRIDDIFAQSEDAHPLDPPKVQDLIS